MKAAVFVDVQNDFVKGGRLAFGYPERDNVSDVVKFAKECAADPEFKIYATRDTHEKTVYEDAGTIINFDGYGRVDSTKQIDGKPVSGYLTTLEGRKLPVEHCVEGEAGWQVVDSLTDVLLGKATFVNKPTFGSYDLLGIFDEDFGEKSPDEITVCGYDLAICVISNALLLRAKYPNVKITIQKDLCGCIDENTFNAALTVAKCCQIDIE